MNRKVVVAVAALAALIVVLVLRRDDDATHATKADGSAASRNGRTAKQLQAAQGQRRIAGVVLLDGKPFAGATVRLAKQRTTLEQRTSDAAGRFDFGMQPAQTYVVAAESPKRTSAIVQVDLKSMRASPEDLHLVLHACDASIFGTVRDAASGAIAGARVGRGTGASAVETNPNGEYELCVEVGFDSIIVTADGYATRVDRVQAYGRVRRDFALVPEAILLGRVVRPDSSPVADAAVSLVLTNTGDTAQATSDAAGKFRVDGLETGSYSITAIADDLASPRATFVAAEIGENADEVVVVVDKAFTVSGKIVAAGAPAAKEWVGLERTDVAIDWRSGMQGMPNAFSAADGTFVLEHVTPGEYRPRTRWRKSPAAAITITNADVTGVVLEVEPSGSIAGRVLRHGKPVEDTPVSARGPSGRAAVSDHEGRYVVEGVTAGTYTLYAESKRVGAFTNGPKVTLAPGEHKTGVDIDMNLAGKISGTVVDQDGAPVANAFVSFSLIGGRDFGNATTEQDGSFTASSLSGGGEYALTIQPSEDSPEFRPANGRKRFAPIAVNDGDTHVTGVVLRVRRELLSIAGRVVDSSGRPLSDVIVSSTPGGSSAITMTDDRGSFIIDQLPRGDYAIEARMAGRRTQIFKIAAGRKDVELTLVAPGALDGTLDGFKTIPDVLVTNTETGVRYQAAVTPTTFKLKTLPTGSYVVSARSRDGLATKSVKVEEGATASVTLARRGFGTIVATLRDDNHKPVSEVYCRAHPSQDDDVAYDLEAPVSTQSDATGIARFERVPMGEVTVMCRRGMKKVQVVEGQITSVELVETAPSPQASRHRSYAGFTVQDVLGDARVSAVKPNGPAAKVGIAVGDIVVKIDDRELERYGGSYEVDAIQYGEVGTTVKLTLERADKEMTVELKLEAPP